MLLRDNFRNNILLWMFRIFEQNQKIEEGEKRNRLKKKIFIFILLDWKLRFKSGYTDWQSTMFLIEW